MTCAVGNRHALCPRLGDVPYEQGEKAQQTMNTKTNRCPRFVRHGKQHRAGLSVLEFVGCVIAVVGGIWLGAIYLGVDLRRVAHEALSDTELLEKVPEDWRPVGAEEEHMTREQLVTTLREELSGLRTEITSLRTARAE